MRRVIHLSQRVGIQWFMLVNKVGFIVLIFELASIWFHQRFQKILAITSLKSTHKPGTDADDRCVLCLRIDMSGIKTVLQVRVRLSGPAAAKVTDCVGGRDEVRVGAEIEMVEVSEGADLIVSSRSPRLQPRAPLPPPEVKSTRKHLSEIVHPCRRNYFIRS